MKKTEGDILQVPTEDKRDICWLVACVLDIRNFTELTARVEELFQSSFIDVKERTRILGAYQEFMSETQELAIREFKKLSIDLGKKFAIKSTGDGLMLALELQDMTFPWHGEKLKGETLDLELTNLTFWKILNAMQDIIHNSYDKDEERDTLGKKTRDFRKKYGKILGFSYERDKHLFGLAGGCAFGLGTFITASDSHLGWIRPGETNPEPLRQVDANGHAVNLAFRLCDAAAREIKMISTSKTHGGKLEEHSKRFSPELLVQRETYHICHYTHTIGHGANEWSDLNRTRYSLDEYQFPDPLKGIEDSWCYGFKVKDL